MRYDTPYIVLVETVQRGEELYHLLLKRLRGHVPRSVRHGVTGIVQVHPVHARVYVPRIEIMQGRFLVHRIPEIGLLTLFPDLCPLVEFLQTRTPPAPE